jgi:hypothetical protein
VKTARFVILNGVKNLAKRAIAMAMQSPSPTLPPETRSFG